MGQWRGHQTRKTLHALMWVFVLVLLGAPAWADDVYRLGSNDIVKIEVFGEEDLSVEAKIGGDGRIQYPLLGPQQAAGLTVQELQQQLTAKLAKGYLKSPRVNVRIVRHRNVFVTGEVRNPGAYAYEEGFTVQKVIAMAGGFTEKAAREAVKLTRTQEGRAETRVMKGGDAVLPDDTIIVAEADTVYVTGEVAHPGRYRLETGMTLQQAVSAAGGFTDKADTRAIQLTRFASGEAEALLAAPGAIVEPNDIIVVTQQNHRFFVSGEVRSPGGYPYREGLTVHKAVVMAGGVTEKADRDNLVLLRAANGTEQRMPVKLETVLLPDDILVVAEGQRVYVSGEVRTPGRYPFESGMTVQKALSLAGGVTERGNKGEIRVTRLNDGAPHTAAILPDALVSADDIITVEPRTQTIYVSGEVKNPGGYPYHEGLTVHKALAMAGGVTEKGEREQLTILRGAHGEERRIPVKLDTTVLPDDIVVVPEGQRVYISGEVRTPGRYRYEAGMTAQKALSLAGGVTERGDKGLIKVARLNDGAPKTVSIEADSLVLPDDILSVEPHIPKVYVSGEVRTPGGYPYQEGLSVHKAVAMAGGLTEKAAREGLTVLRNPGGAEIRVPVKLETTVQPEDIIVVPEGQQVYVTGEVRTPGRYRYEQGLTVQKALSLAGGLTERGEGGVIRVTRLNEGAAPKTSPAEADALLGPDDIVTVEPHLQKVYVSGEVKSPGGYPYREGLSVHKALAMAGGLTDKAERDLLTVLRTVGDEERRLPVKLESAVLPDDIIVVAEGQRFYVNGEVRTPGRYLYERGLTVQKALSMAGGLTERADRTNLRVSRKSEGSAELVPVDWETMLRPDDILLVSQAQKFYVNGEVRKPGDYAYERGLTIHKAITMAGGFTDKAAERRTRVLRVVDGVEQSIKVSLDALVQPDDIIVVPQSFF